MRGLRENYPAVFDEVDRKPLDVTCTLPSIREATRVLGTATFFDTGGMEQTTVQEGGGLTLSQIAGVGGVGEPPDAATSPVVAVLLSIAGVVVIGALALAGAAWRTGRQRASE